MVLFAARSGPYTHHACAGRNAMRTRHAHTPCAHAMRTRLQEDARDVGLEECRGCRVRVDVQIRHLLASLAALLLGDAHVQHDVVGAVQAVAPHHAPAEPGGRTDGLSASPGCEPCGAPAPAAQPAPCRLAHPLARPEEELVQGGLAFGRLVELVEEVLLEDLPRRRPHGGTVATRRGGYRLGARHGVRRQAVRCGAVRGGVERCGA